MIVESSARLSRAKQCASETVQYVNALELFDWIVSHCGDIQAVDSRTLHDARLNTASLRTNVLALNRRDEAERFTHALDLLILSETF
jgi:hypothetical protein